MEGRWCTALTSHVSEVKQVLSQVGGLCSGSLTCLSVFARVHSMPGSIFQKAQMAELCSEKGPHCESASEAGHQLPTALFFLT